MKPWKLYLNNTNLLSRIQIHPIPLYQSGQSRDLFCTCFRTEGVRKLAITSLILNEFSCGKVQIPCLRKQQTNIEVFSLLLQAVF